jgi:hypothetical protein
MSHCAADDLRTNVWGPATNNVQMSLSIDYKAISRTAKAGSPSFSLDSITNIGGFMEQVKLQSNPVSRYLWQRFSQDEQLLVTNYQTNATNAHESESVAVDALNRIIGGPFIWVCSRICG